MADEKRKRITQTIRKGGVTVVDPDKQNQSANSNSVASEKKDAGKK